MMAAWFSANIISLKARDLDESLDDLFILNFRVSFMTRKGHIYIYVYITQCFHPLSPFNYVQFSYKGILNANLISSNKTLLFPSYQTGLSSWCLTSWTLQGYKWRTISSPPCKLCVTDRTESDETSYLIFCRVGLKVMYIYIILMLNNWEY